MNESEQENEMEEWENGAHSVRTAKNKQSTEYESTECEKQSRRMGKLKE